MKHVDPRDDWIMRQTGDIGCIPIRVWEAGVFDLVPDVIDHAVVGAAREGAHGAVLQRDVGAWLLPPGDDPIDAEQHLRFLDHLASLHAATWGWRDDRRAAPGGEPLLVLRTRRARVRGGARVPASRSRASRPKAGSASTTRAPSWPTRSVRCDARRGRCSTRSPTRPTALLHGDTKFGNVGFGADGRTDPHRLVADRRGTTARGDRRTRSRSTVPASRRSSRDDATVGAYRAALERHGVDTAPWFERQLALCLVGVMLQLGWEKAFDETGTELTWWRDRTVDTARELTA